jgi:hypothetical protein
MLELFPGFTPLQGADISFANFNFDARWLGDDYHKNSN